MDLSNLKIAFFTRSMNYSLYKLSDNTISLPFKHYRLTYTTAQGYLEKILKYNPELIYKYIKILVQNFEIFVEEAEDLCLKLNTNFEEIFQQKPIKELKLIKKELNNQLYFDFNMMKAA